MAASGVACRPPQEMEMAGCQVTELQLFMAGKWAITPIWIQMTKLSMDYNSKIGLEPQDKMLWVDYNHNSNPAIL